MYNGTEGGPAISRSPHKVRVPLDPLLLSHPLLAPPPTPPDLLWDQTLPPVTPGLPPLSPPATEGSATHPQTPPAKHPSQRRNDGDAPPSTSTGVPPPVPPSEPSPALPAPPPCMTCPRTDHPGATGAPGPSLKKRSTKEQREEEEPRTQGLQPRRGDLAQQPVTPAGL
ncbi:hypothetical protein C0992_006824 [Termitomyces sp. T32_za158]|nr:hypothetical protein C0992_006824 [Termitomyces sp. T32_za158]